MQTEVIGSRGKNWPVTEGRDQVRLITSGFAAAAVGASEDLSSSRGRSAGQSLVSSRSTSPSKKHIKDPHASLDLFSSKTADENARLPGPNVVAPRASARPPPRDMNELFAAGHEDHEPGSPKKPPVSHAVAPKGRSNQNFAPHRLFADDVEEPAAAPYKSNPAKYNHFDMGDTIEDDPLQHRDAAPATKAAVPLRGKSGKHSSQWDFQDFYTPAKPGQKVRDQDVVHFSLDNASNKPETPAARGVAKPRRDNEAHFEFQDDGTPVERHAVPKPRKDAETHFQFRDTDTPAPSRTAGRPTSSASDRNGLYTNNLFGQDEDSKGQEKPPLATITNNKGRKNDFDSHWTMADESPASEKTSSENNHKSKAGKHSNLRKGLESHWNMGGVGDEDEDEPLKRNSKKGFWDF